MATILVVDDNKYFLELACGFIASQGHECLRANSRSEALQIISEREPDCYVLDIRLEEAYYGEKKADGVDLFEEIKNLSTGRRVIFTSAHTDFEEEYLLRRGATTLIDKNRFPRDIIGALKEAFYPRVLLVEDDEAFAYIASELFESKKVKCVRITDTQEMRNLVDQCDFSTFDAVIADALLTEDYHGWDVLNQIPISYSRDSVFFLTGKTMSEIESELGEKTQQGSKEALLAGICHLSDKNVLDKQRPSWADVITNGLAAREAANG